MHYEEVSCGGKKTTRGGLERARVKAWLYRWCEGVRGSDEVKINVKQAERSLRLIFNACQLLVMPDFEKAWHCYPF